MRIRCPVDSPGDYEPLEGDAFEGWFNIRQRLKWAGRPSGRPEQCVDLSRAEAEWLWRQLRDWCESRSGVASHEMPAASVTDWPDDVPPRWNGGILCDTWNGPCRCGAWHHEGQ